MPDKETLIPYIYARLGEAPAISKDYIEKDGVPYNYRTAFYGIKKYIDDFIVGDDENRFLVMPGLRGVGKTTIMLQIYDYLLNGKGIENDRILYLNADELKLFLEAGIKDIIPVYVEEIHKTSMPHLEERIFILIDEAHYDENWSLTGKIVYDQTRKIFMLFTGSSALSLEINVDATRRIIKEKIFPLNFAEYLLLKHNITPPDGLADGLNNLIWQREDNSINQAIENENEMQKRMFKLKRSPSKEWEDYLSYGGFPFGFKANQTEIYNKIFAIVNRLIEKDVYSLKNFTAETRSTISRVITSLSMQKPGETSDSKLAERLKASPTLIRTILNILEKTQLIFSVKPYGGPGKMIRKPWKYYFLSPSINAALNYKLGNYDPANREILGGLAESLVASTFFRWKETHNIPLNISYPTEKRGADFLLFRNLDDIIPVEVGLNKKKTGQLKKSIRNHESNYGILISNGFSKIDKKNNIITIPLTTFSFL